MKGFYRFILGGFLSINFAQAHVDTPESPPLMPCREPIEVITDTGFKDMRRSEKDRFRVSLSEAGSKGTDYNPLTPAQLETYSTALLFEYFPTDSLNLGFASAYSQIKSSRRRTPDWTRTKSIQFIPFLGYLLSPQWLFNALAGGGYIDDNSFLLRFSTDTVPTSHLRQQRHYYTGAAYLTWIGPNQPISGSIRGGFRYDFYHTRRAIDTFGTVVPSSNFERGAIYLSGRLKYEPTPDWQYFLQLTGNYSTKLTAISTVYRSTTGRQRSQLTIGGGIHYRFTHALAIRIAYFRNEGYGFFRENVLAVRLRALF